MNSTAPSFSTPAGPARRSAVVPLAAVLTVLAVAAPLPYRAAMGPAQWAYTAGLAALAAAVLAGAWRLETRRRTAAGQAARHARDAAAHADGLRRLHAERTERENALRAHTAELSAALDRLRDDNRDLMESQRMALVALSRRVQSAMHRVQAEAATTAERHRDLPEVYLSCQAIDHLAAQSARLAQGLAVVAGTWEGQQWDAPMRLAEVVQAAQGRIEDYHRVRIEGDPDLAIAPAALESLIHVLAELLANATESSPTATPVTVKVTAAAQGAVFRIDDHGAGLEEPRLGQARGLLDGIREVTLAEMGEVPRLGLPVVARYVRRHGFKVDLDESPYGGLRVVVLVPGGMVTAPPEHRVPQQRAPARPAPVPPPAGPAEPPLAAPGPGSAALPRRVSRRGRPPAAAPGPAPVAPSPETPGEAAALMSALIDIPGGPAATAGTTETTDTTGEQGRDD